MNWLDIGVVAIIVLSAVFAFARGFVREAFSVIAWIGAAAITLYGFGWAYDRLEPYIHNPLLSQVVAGFGLFVGSLVVLTMATGIVARMVSATAFSPIDRTLGFVFGLARGVFLVCLAYLLVATALPPTDWPPWLRDAKSGPYLSEGADLLKGFLPESLKLKSADLVPAPVDPAVEARRAMRALAMPTQPTPGKLEGKPALAKPEDKPEAAAAPRYREQNRRELDRLIGSQH
jgi:membrane protein required for colicin V production